MWHTLFEGPTCMTGISRCLQQTLLRGGDRTCCLARGLANICALSVSREEKERPLSGDVSRSLRWNFFLAHEGSFFQAWAGCASSQRTPGRLIFLYLCFLFCLFHLIFLRYCFLYFLFHTHKLRLFKKIYSIIGFPPSLNFPHAISLHPNSHSVISCSICLSKYDLNQYSSVS